MNFFSRDLAAFAMLSSFLFSFSGAVMGKPIEAFESREFSMPGNVHTMPYRLYVPKHYDGSQPLPLVINLHGLGGSGGGDQQMDNHASGGMYFADDEFQSRQPSFVLIPQEPSTTNLHWDDSVVGDLLFALIESLEAEFSIDPDRIYLGGISMGGHGVWRLLAQSPNRFAAAFPSAGWSNSGDAASIRHIPIWAFHAADDSVVNVNGSRNMVAAVRNAGGSVIYTEFNSGGHVIGPVVSRQRPLWDWLLAQRRGVPPAGSPLVTIGSVIKGSELSLAGSAQNGEEGVTRVEWVNNRGGSGTAVGTTDWSVASIPLQSGTNVIRVTGFGPSPADSLTGETSFNTTLTIQHTAPVGDLIPPNAEMTGFPPDSIQTTQAQIGLTGTASDNSQVAAVIWSNDRGGSGAVTGTTTWAVDVPLDPGENTISITTSDSAGNFNRRSVRVNRTSLVNAPPNVLAGPDVILVVPQHSLIPESHVGDDGLPASAVLQWSQVAGPPGVTFDNAAALRPTAYFPMVGDYELELTASDGQHTVSDRMNVQVRTPPVFAASEAVAAINLNGPRYTDADGVDYFEGSSALDQDPDYAWFPASYADSGNAISGTSDPLLYQTAFFARGSFEMKIPVPNGDYVVTLKMVDFSAALGSNLRDIYLEGFRVLDKYDVRAHAPRFGAHDVHVPVTVNDGELHVYHENFEYRALLAAIVIRGALPPESNTPPQVDAGASFQTLLNQYGQPTPEITDDGALPGRLFPILSWSQVSGPGTAYFNDSTLPRPRVTFSDPGEYVLRLDVDDGEYPASDTVTVVVTAPSNARIQLDVGDFDSAPLGWTAVDKHFSANHSNLVNEFGVPTNVGLLIEGGFLNKDRTGLTNSTLYHSDAVRDGFYTSQFRVAGFKFTGLDPEKSYQLKIYASTTLDPDATGIYTVGDVSGTLQAYNNTSETVTLPGLIPEEDGTMILAARPDGAVGVVVINVMILSEEYVPSLPPGFSAWIRSQYPDADESVTAMDADPEIRGLSNLKAYALAAERGDTAQSVEPYLSLEDDSPAFCFNRRTTSDLAYEVMVSGDLDGWTSLASILPGESDWTGPGVVEETTSDPRSVRVYDIPADPDEPLRRFYQLIITPIY